MPYNYTYLPELLHSTAESAADWFRDNWGIRKSDFQVESVVHPDARLRPTFLARTSDFHTLCVEVMEVAYNPHLADFILECQKRSLPVLLFVAVPRGFKDPDLSQNLKSAKTAGVGLLE